MQIRLFNGEAELILSRNFKIDNFNYETRNRIETSALQDGGRQVGLGFFDSLEFVIEGSFKNKGVSTDLQISSLISWLKHNEGFSLQIIGDSKYLSNCYLKGNETETFIRGDYVKIKIKIISEDVYWQEDVSLSFYNVTSGTILNIQNNGDYSTLPIFTITSKEQISDFYIINNATQRTFNVKYPNWTSNTIGIFDSINNKATINNVNIIEYTNGNFVSLIKGNNPLKILGGACDIIIDFKKRFTF